MATAVLNQNIPIPNQLAHWLALKSDESSATSNIQYHLVGRAALLGASLLSLAEAVGRAILGSLALFGYVLSLGHCEQAKIFGSECMQDASHAGSTSVKYLYSIASPKELVNRLAPTPETTSVQQPHLIVPTPSVIIAPTTPRTLFSASAPARIAPIAPTVIPVTAPIAPPLIVPVDPAVREWRVQQGAELITEKLQRQFERAQNQAAQENDGAFQYVPAPRNFRGEAHTEIIAGREVGVCHFIGRRREMEDEHLATDFNLNIAGQIFPVQLFGIFDGHGGDEAAIFARDNLQRVLHQTLNEFCINGLSDEAIWNALKITFVRLSRDFIPDQSGTTATVAMKLDGKLWTANVGDSRTILDNGIQLSEDAKPTDPYYRRGIGNRGGVVYRGRVNGILAVARGVGDHGIGAVSSRPKITACSLAAIPQGTRLILTCDGIYDVSSTRQIAAAVRAHQELTAEDLAKNIVYSAYQAHSGDNLSALVVDL